MRIFPYSSTWTHCHSCGHPMKGIHSSEVREICQECGGEAIIGNSPEHQAKVQQAWESLQEWERRRICTPFHPRPSGQEAA